MVVYFIPFRRFAVSRALRKMYGMPMEWNSIPPMPADGNSWSVMHSWAMPTRSFLEFVMFSRLVLIKKSTCILYKKKYSDFFSE